MLQPSSQDQSLVYLQVIAAQLTAGANATTTTFPLASSASSQATSVVVRVNAAWFAGLVLSLVTALVGILVKQWLRAYASQHLTSARDAVRMRQFRHSGLLAWRVADVVACLPLLLQTSLVLFLVGLLDLLWATTAPVVAMACSLIVAISFASIAVSVVCPLIFPGCPFKSPLSLQLRSSWILVRGLLRTLWSSHHPRSTSAKVFWNSWWDVDAASLATIAQGQAKMLEYGALRWAYSTLLDDRFQDALSPCVAELSPRWRLSFVLDELARHASTTPEDLMRRVQHGLQAATNALYGSMLKVGHRTNERILGMILDVLSDAELTKLTGVERRDSPFPAADLVERRDNPFPAADLPSLGRLDLLNVIHPLLNAYTMTGRRQYIPREAITQRVFDVLLSGLTGVQPHVMIEGVFGLLLSFDHLFWQFVTPDGESADTAPLPTLIQC
jgi:hypothetical protein